MQYDVCNMYHTIYSIAFWNHLNSQQLELEFLNLIILQIDEELETLTNLQYDHMIKTTSIPPTEMINTDRLSVVSSKLDQVLKLSL